MMNWSWLILGGLILLRGRIKGKHTVAPWITSRLKWLRRSTCTTTELIFGVWECWYINCALVPVLFHLLYTARLPLVKLMWRKIYRLWTTLFPKTFQRVAETWFPRYWSCSLRIGFLLKGFSTIHGSNSRQSRNQSWSRMKTGRPSWRTNSELSLIPRMRRSRNTRFFRRRKSIVIQG